MRVLMATPECFPFVTTGGLGEMVSGFVKVLARRGYEVHVGLPLYGSVWPNGDWTKTDNIAVPFGDGIRLCSVWTYGSEGVTYHFIEYHAYFGGNNVYGGLNEGERFAFFCRALLAVCEAFRWCPDIIHAHDWTTALLPVYLNTTLSHSPLYRTATVFTIHNLNYQGLFSPSLLYRAGIPMSEFHPHSLEALGYVNFLKGALYHATKLTTVSPHYAKEIQTPSFGCGLDDVLRFKAADLIGILNGIDTMRWDPSNDPSIAAHYTCHNLEPKETCKQALRQLLQLPNEHVPLFGVVSRLCEQKGLDVLLEILPYLLRNLSMQLVVMGSGEPSWEARLRDLDRNFPNRLRVKIGYEADLAHKIYAGCDFCVMPSRFEPCGLNQMYALRYGMLPIVRETGGLADTVENCDEINGRGCGFVFQDLTNDALYNTVGWACATYFDRLQLFRTLQRNAMKRDFGWERLVQAYEEVYRWAVERRSSG